MLRLTLISLGMVVAAWIVMRLWRARGPMRRLADERLDEDGLRAGAEAILAARLSRGEIDDATYARTMQALWGLPVTLEAEEPVPVAEAASANADPVDERVAEAEPAVQPEPADPVAEPPAERPRVPAAAELQGELQLGEAPPEY